MRKLPIFEAKINDENEGAYCLSFVDYPATEVSWQVFKEQDKKQSFSIDDEDKHLVRGVFMTANKLIYRKDKSGFEYYITFSENTLRKMAENFLMNGFNKNIDTNHNDELEDGIYLQEIFFKDVEKGINPVGYEDVEDKSLFCQYRVNNDALWQKIKEGEFTGFSLAGIFDSVEVSEPEDEEFNEIVELINKLKNKIK